MLSSAKVRLVIDAAFFACLFLVRIWRRHLKDILEHTLCIVLIAK
jgi:hypothetical protein